MAYFSGGGSHSLKDVFINNIFEAIYRICRSSHEGIYTIKANNFTGQTEFIHKLSVGAIPNSSLATLVVNVTWPV